MKIKLISAVLFLTLGLHQSANALLGHVITGAVLIGQNYWYEDWQSWDAKCKQTLAKKKWVKGATCQSVVAEQEVSFSGPTLFRFNVKGYIQDIKKVSEWQSNGRTYYKEEIVVRLAEDTGSCQWGRCYYKKGRFLARYHVTSYKKNSSGGSGGYKYVASEGQTLKMNKNGNIRYGRSASSQYSQKYFRAGWTLNCSHNYSGGRDRAANYDPARGVRKNCYALPGVARKHTVSITPIITPIPNSAPSNGWHWVGSEGDRIQMNRGGNVRYGRSATSGYSQKYFRAGWRFHCSHNYGHGIDRASHYDPARGSWKNCYTQGSGIARRY